MSLYNLFPYNFCFYSLSSSHLCPFHLRRKINSSHCLTWIVAIAHPALVSLLLLCTPALHFQHSSQRDPLKMGHFFCHSPAQKLSITLHHTQWKSQKCLWCVLHHLVPLVTLRPFSYQGPPSLSAPTTKTSLLFQNTPASEPFIIPPRTSF